jgi:hypothetical protein
LSSVDTLWAFDIYASYSNPGDVSVDLGFTIVNDKQRVKISNAATATGGYFILTYSDSLGETDFTVDLNESPPLDPIDPPEANAWALRFQEKIREITNLEDVTVVAVTGNYEGTDLTFEVTFVGTSGKRYHNSLSLKENSLTSDSAIDFVFSKIVNGSPINRVADEIDSETTVPVGLNFYSVPDLAVTPLQLGDLRPQDFLPIWVKRIVPPNCEPLENDGFTLEIKGSAIQP